MAAYSKLNVICAFRPGRSLGFLWLHTPVNAFDVLIDWLAIGTDLCIPGGWRGLDKQALEGCLGVVALALGVVMAGTGHLPTLKLLRGTALAPVI